MSSVCLLWLALSVGAVTHAQALPAEAAADAVFPLRPAADDAGAHGLQFA
jgi:hypothetical protein